MNGKITPMRFAVSNYANPNMQALESAPDTNRWLKTYLVLKHQLIDREL
jgi:hypothetical protein